MTIIVGIDPGTTTGIAICEFGEGWDAGLIQCDSTSAAIVVQGLISEIGSTGHTVAALAVERFVSGPRSGKLATPSGAGEARKVIGDLSGWADEHAIPVYLRSAGEVKPWATDARVRKLINLRGMPHAYDALRHALFCAVKDLGAPDPLSRRSASGARS